MRRGLSRTAVGVAALAMLATALATGRSPGVEATRPVASWAARADAWVRAFIATRDPVDLVPFYDPDVVMDARALAGMGYGRGGTATLLDTAVGEADLAWTGVPYLSRDGVVVQEAPPFAGTVLDFAWALTVGAGGITRWGFYGSVAGARIFKPPADEAVFTALPARYLAAWRSGDPTAVADLYTEHATLRDTLEGVSLSGRAEIAAAVGAAHDRSAAAPWLLHGARLQQLPDDRGDAVFVNGWVGTAWDRELLLLEAGLGPGCRGHVAVVLDLAGTQVSREERYYRLDDARRCMPGLPDGWWSAVRVPERGSAAVRAVEVPGRVHSRVWNGDPATDALLLWAYGRFAEAGLPPPNADLVLVEGPGARSCLGAARYRGDPLVVVCAARAVPCFDDRCSTGQVQARAGVLRELGRLWTDQSGLESPACPAVVRSPATRGCPRPVADRQASYDATVVAWGLMDQAWLPPELTGTDCDQLAARFRRLTGTAPLQACPLWHRG